MYKENEVPAGTQRLPNCPANNYGRDPQPKQKPLNKYAYTLQSDNGPVRITINAESEFMARSKVLSAEKAPLIAIDKVTRNGKALKYVIYSPDGFTIRYDKTYKNPAEALADFEAWKEQYKIQGYYSTARRERIELFELVHHCTLKAIETIF